MPAMFHLQAKVISRGDGRSTTAAVAYTAGQKIVDERTGQIHDYSKKRGVLHSELILPAGGTASRSEFWNRLEKHHKRGDAVLAREFIAALPAELVRAARQALAVGFADELSNRYGVAADVALHEPRTITDRDLENDPDQYFEIDSTGWRHNANWHSHIVLSACHASIDGALGKKAVEMDPIHCQRAKIENMVDWARRRWADLVNAALESEGHSVRVDHQSLEAQGITNRLPGAHLGPAGSSIKRRGEESEIEKRENAKVLQFIADMEAAAQAQAQDDAEIAEIEAQLAEQQAERVLAEARAQAQAARERQEEAERQRLAALAQTAQAVAQAERLQMELAQAQALALAREEYEKADHALAQAVRVEREANMAVEQLRGAAESATAGQKQAGQSLLKSAQALLKAPSWSAAIKTYETALEALSAASRAVSTARQVVVLAWGKLLGLDPAERVRQTARIAPQTPQAAEVWVTPAPARQQVPGAVQPAPAMLMHQVHQHYEEPEPPGPAPGM